ncbi:MAG: hypothetical protein WA979_14245 [Pacificimonas sp.]
MPTRVALLFARDPETGDVRHAAMPLAGRSLLERQADLAARSGASRFVVLIDGMAPDVAAAIARLRDAGRDVAVIHDIQRLAGNLADADDVLMLGDGCLYGHHALERLVSGCGSEGRILGVAAPKNESAALDRLDDAHVSAGAALYPADHVRMAMAEMGAWDLNLALPRAVRQQGGLTVVPIQPDEIVSAADRDADIENWVMSRHGSSQEEAPSSASITAMLRPLLRQFARRRIEPMSLRVTAVLAALLAVGCFAFGWFWSGWGLAVLAVLCFPIADDLAALLSRRSANSRIFRFFSVAVESMGYAAIIWHADGRDLVLLSALLGAIVIDVRMVLIRERGGRIDWDDILGSTMFRLVAVGLGTALMSSVAGLGLATLVTFLLIIVRQQKLFRSGLS